MIASVSITTFVFLKTQTQTLSSGPTKGQILYQSNTFIVPIANLACSFVSELPPSPSKNAPHKSRPAEGFGAKYAFHPAPRGHLQ
jgi:hypothetical protein